MKKNNHTNRTKVASLLALITLPVGLTGCTGETTTTTITLPATQTQIQSEVQTGIEILPMTQAETQSQQENEVQNQTETQTQTSEVTSKLNYKNGTYEAVGEYNSPAGVDKLGVKLTVDKGIITAATIEMKAENEISKKFQQTFNDNYKEYVVGKNIADLNLSIISGSSLTPIGFNDALKQIKAEAIL